MNNIDNQFEIKFGKSASSNYNRVLRIAKKFSVFHPISEDNNRNLIQLDTDELLRKCKTFEELSGYISGWKSTEILFNGEFVEPYKFYKYKEIINCPKKHAESADKTKHCYINYQKEGRGCRFLTNIRRHVEQGYYYHYDKYWYEFGNFNKDINKWNIDKSLLKQMLVEKVKEKKINFCPVFSFDRLDQIIKVLPDEIELKEDDFWEIQYEEDFYGSTIEKKPIGIRHQESNNKGGTNVFSIGVKEFNDDEQEELTNNRNVPKVTFDDIGGIDEIIEQI